MKNLTQFGQKLIFLPDATQGTVRFVTNDQLKKTGTYGVVINTLHLLIGMGVERIKNLGGMHKFMNWDGWLLSDSGGFQVFSLLHRGKWKGKITKDGAIFKSPKDGTQYELTPETSIDIQMALDSDILVTLDDCRDTDISRDEAEESVKNTIVWAERAKNHFEQKYGGTEKTGKLLSCVVQGASFLDLREKCARELTKLNFDGYNFGGYVVDSGGNLVVDEMRVAIENTPAEKFHYAMGVGKPRDIFEGVKLGYRVFDTVLVTRNARHGSVYSTDEIIGETPDQAGSSANSNGLLHIKNAKYAEDKRPIDSKCDCEACQNHSRAYIHNLFKMGEATALQLMTIHNLRFYQRLISGLNLLGTGNSGNANKSYPNMVELMY